MRDRGQDADGQTDAQTDRQRDRPRPILPRFATPSHKNELVRLAATDANTRAVTDERNSLTEEADSSAVFPVIFSFIRDKNLCCSITLFRSSFIASESKTEMS